MTDKHLLYWIILAINNGADNENILEVLDRLKAPDWAITAYKEALEQLENKS